MGVCDLVEGVAWNPWVTLQVMVSDDVYFAESSVVAYVRDNVMVNDSRVVKTHVLMSEFRSNLCSPASMAISTRSTTR